METRKYKIIFIVLWGLLILVGTIFAIVFYHQGTWVLENHVAINNLSICEGNSNAYTSAGQKPEIFNGIESIKICGNLVTQVPVELQIYLFSSGESRPISHNNLREVFKEGDFSSNVLFHPKSRPGLYNIKVYYARNLLNQIDFVVLH